MGSTGELVVVVAGPAWATPTTEEGDEDRKKQRRRASRRSRRGLEFRSSADAYHNENNGVSSRSVSGDGYRLLPEGDDARSAEEASEVVFSSLPNMPIKASWEGYARCGEVSSSVPQSLAAREGKISGSVPMRGPLFEDRSRKKLSGFGSPRYFDSHWTEDAVNQALENGRAFKAVFRVNAFNRLEAYCTLVGVPVDILISGAASQNRAVEGDVVAIMLNPVASWTRLKSSAVQLSHSDSIVESTVSLDVTEVVNGTVKDISCEHSCSNGSKLSSEKCSHRLEKVVSGPSGPCCLHDDHQYFTPEALNTVHDLEDGELERSLKGICNLISSFPLKRPTGRVLAIIEPSPRREAVVGFLSAKKRSDEKVFNKQDDGSTLSRQHDFSLFSDRENVYLVPTDARFPEMVVTLLAARIEDWSEESFLPQAHVMHVFGQGGEIEPQIAAILFEHAICCADFSSESLSCLPTLPWKIPSEELEKRKDLRDLCTFTIDPSFAIELDDALSFEKVSDDVYRVGVHIADVSYFVQPDSALDTEAQVRSTSVYILQHKLPMLPFLLSSKLVSLLPSEDKLAFSIMWEINLSGNVLRQWIGRSVIRSCCKLSYEDAQKIIDECDSASSLPALHGQFKWKDITTAIKKLHEISEKLNENRLEYGALGLENAKLEILFDDYGNPYDSTLRQQMASHSLVREFMLLANKTAAKVISRAFPDCALLRRHPEPNLRKLKEFKAFCGKHGFELDTATSSHLHLSLVKIRERLKDDPVLFDILISYALRPMQLATYISTGDFRNREDEWAHYALGVPQYTHFTSPLRRYPDIIVHRMLLAALEGEDMYMRQRIQFEARQGEAYNGSSNYHGTGAFFDESTAESAEFKEALFSAAVKHGVPCATELSEMAAYCNKRKLASKQAEEAGERHVIDDYSHAISIERRISYGDVDGLGVEWLENTSTLVLHLHTSRRHQRRPSAGKLEVLKEVALITDPSGPISEPEEREVLPAVFPLTLQPLSTIPVVLHAVGGDGRRPEIGCISSRISWKILMEMKYPFHLRRTW
ncbi:unnamed protein product [Spirodela intermedia]|uniref:DIS3-like exonuclease 2 n=1 Tax=Spirodela intermedia TaxID=51605 RepID=A0A7I8ILJ5_SPIIN|nr:unnamed protein product [Spirodela intermedia]CAA6658824.1 unnamed protein product [Spirodela intermedia]